MKHNLIPFILFGLLNSFAAEAQTHFFKLGVYQVGQCNIVVDRGAQSGTLQIKAYVRSGGFGNLVIEAASNQVLSINSCNDAFSDHDYPMKNTQQTVDGVTVYQAVCGGSWQDKSAKAKIVLGHSGKITALQVVVKEASATLSNGMHSGPIKDIQHQFTCI